MMMRLIALLFLLIGPTFAQAQIKGKIVDEQGKPLIGANILIIGTTKGTVCDMDGMFNLDLNSSARVKISYIGYKSQELDINPGTFHEIILIKDLSSTISSPTILEDKYYNPFAYKKLDRIKIQEIDILNPANIYNPTPGLFMHSGALNTNRLTIRGIGSRSPFSTTKIKAYLNDIPLTSGIGESNLEDLNLSILDEIKIYKGPSQPHFGSGLGGIIHYKTSANRRSNNKVSNTTSYGSFNTIHNNIAYNYYKEGIIFSLNHDYLKSDGYRDNNHYERQNISGFAQANFEKDVLTVFVSQTYLDAEIPSGLNIEDFTNTPEAAAANWNGVEGYEDSDKTQVAITHQRSFNKGWSSTVTGFTTSFQNYERRPFNVLTQNSKSIGARVLVEKVFQEISGGLKFGNELFFENEEWSTYETLEQGQGNILSDNYEKRNYKNLFAEAYYMINRLRIDLGANVNLTSYDFEDRYVADGVDQSGLYSFAPIVSPFLSIRHQKLSRNIYANVSHGYSAPTLEETLTPNGQINPDIKPETGWNTEIGLRNEIGDFNIDLSIYNMWVQNLLVAQRVTEDQFVGINAGKTLHPGLEASIEYFKRNFKRNNNNLKVNIDYNFQPHRFTEFVNRDIDFAGKRLPGNPEHKLSSSIDYTFKKLHIRASNLFVSKMFADDLNSITVDSYNVTNLSLMADLIHGSSLPRYLYAGLPRNFKFTVQFSHIFK